MDVVAALPASVHIALAGLIGLMIGSFLNVVIYRYPKILEHQWTAQSYEWLNKEEYSEHAPAGIGLPASHCFACKTPLRLWHNIPVISFLFLRGRCAQCKEHISWRYPVVELLSAVMSAVVVWQLGWSVQSLFGLLLTWVLIALTFIDIDHQLLPDDIVLPTLWFGLGLTLVPVFALSADAILGALAGYLSFWLVFQLFKLLTGKEGMGHGDFKLMALLGAWLGWQFLPQIILISTITGSLMGISMIAMKRANADNAIPFGPYIALAGWIALLWGGPINQAYLAWLGA